MNNPAFEEKEVKLANTALARALWPYIRPYAWMLLVSSFLALAVTGFELIIPLLIQKALDGFILPAGPVPGTRFFGIEFTTFKGFGLLFLGLVLAEFGISFFQTLFMEYTGQKIILNLRCRLFSHMSRLPVAYFDKNASGRLVSRVASDIENMNEMFTSVLIFMAKDMVLMAGGIAAMIYLAPGAALPLAGTVPIILAAAILFSRAARGAFRTIRQKIGEINHQFSEAVTGIKVIQTIPAGPAFIRRFNRLNRAHFRAALFQIKLFALFMPFIGFMATAMTAGMLWKGGSSVMENAMTIGELTAALTYIKIFFRPLRELAEKFNLLQNALASGERIVTVLNQHPAGATGHAPLKTAPNPIDNITRVEFNHIRFSYQKGTPVLQDISFCLEQGKSLGIAGRTGAGKSSIINLLTGFYPPDSGRILINGTDLGRLDIAAVRARTALVMQDPILFSGTIRDNIRPWGTDLGDALLESALDKAGCRFLSEKFKGLDTELKEGGSPLSSGEKQLVCIARAFAVDPDLIIFDEATSYMDSASEQAIHQAMEKLLYNRMSILIAHRLSTIRNCDTILLLSKGTIREQGSHQELVDLGGEYFHLLQKENI